ncbi:uncharacterized protein LOC113514575 isoform X2 [Galleria mellonella]|uniref:Uncharacterized protein LOC113514575 isoform X2 n=1 Tax=Galleria mellonella TaxID=7137 RepID=A0ABM3MJC3_GALME|nr:uncharacterized protein LOC113514575 isoform X2 [Galleria mellonella]
MKMHRTFSCPCEEHEEVIPEEIPEEEKQQIVEELFEEETEVFPSPSLRRILPDKIRKIEEQNKIHVLPEEFKTDIDPAAIPKIAYTAQQKYIDILAEIVGCTKYKSSLAEFWFLDTLANLLRRAQEDELDRPTQAILILWFCEWMKEIQHFDAADRNRMLKRFQDNMVSAARFIAEEERLPTPTEAGVYYQARENLPGAQELGPNIPTELKQHLVTFKGAAYECSLRDLTKIIHYIFDLFSTDYQYNLVRSIFTFTPEYMLIDAPFQIQNSKGLYVPLKFKPKKEKSPKKDSKQTKGKKREIDTEEYLALMELKAKEERELEEQEKKDREDWHRRNHILPLNFAADDAFFDKYWPPPPPEPIIEPEPEPKGKGKGKGKK